MSIKYGYFPGCSLESTAVEFGSSMKAVAKALDIELKEIEDWNCCGSTPAHQSSRYLPATLSMRNLVKAERMGMEEILVPCASCFSRMRFSLHEVGEDKKFRGKIEEILGAKIPRKIKVTHILEIFRDPKVMAILKEKQKMDLKGLKVACYYGCLLVRPREIAAIDDPEEPTIMEDLVKSIGAEPIYFPFKTECCGAGMSITQPGTMLRLGKLILEDAKRAEADIVITACPLCHANLDMRQSQINAKFNTELNIPVLYLTQLLGLALGLEEKDLMISKHITSPLELLKKKALI